MTENRVFAISFMFGVLTVALFIAMLATRAGKIRNKPIDDSNWQANDKVLNAVRTKFLANKQETIEGLLGQNFIIDVIAKNDYKHGFCFVTNKAYYFVGNICQQVFGAIYRKTNVQHRINADELKGVTIKRTFLFRTLFFLLISLFIFIISIRLLILSNDFHKGVICIASIVISLVLSFFMIVGSLLNIILQRRTILCFEFVSHNFYFPIGILGQQEIKDFYKSVSNVQEIVKNQVQNVNMRAAVTVPADNKIEQLRSLASLKEQGAISAEEFNALKSEIMGVNNDVNESVQVQQCSEKHVCPNCSAEVSDTAKFCGKCGYKLQNISNES